MGQTIDHGVRLLMSIAFLRGSGNDVGLVRRMMIVLATLALMASLIVGTAPASASPSKDPILAANALYTTGPVPESVCAEKPISKRNNFAEAKAYVTTVVGCLNRVWAKQLAKSRQTFKRPKVTLLAKDPAKFCGSAWEQVYMYCWKNQTMLMVLDRRMLNGGPDDLYIFNATAMLYAVHVQVLTGIDAAIADNYPAGNAARMDFNRRAHLQVMCLSGVFTSSVYKSMPRNAADWKDVVGQMGREASVRYGKAASIKYWMNRGFNSRDPRYCNTWTVPNSRVA